uniref:Uncharacterized protein n=1 Tax=Panagrolaimus sp. PS1159 TaxID=55785 RepID=A0AC35G915_9BILA
MKKTVSLMCVFLRQFHTELRTRKDRRSKLEIILKLWTELQKQSTQGNPINIPSEVYQLSAAVTLMQQPPPPAITTDDVTIKTNTVSPTATTSTSTLNVFVQKKKTQQKSKL